MRAGVQKRMGIIEREKQPRWGQHGKRRVRAINHRPRACAQKQEVETDARPNQTVERLIRKFLRPLASKVDSDAKQARQSPAAGLIGHGFGGLPWIKKTVQDGELSLKFSRMPDGRNKPGAGRGDGGETKKGRTHGDDQGEDKLTPLPKAIEPALKKRIWTSQISGRLAFAAISGKKSITRMIRLAT